MASEPSQHERLALISFDVEQFDIPTEYGHALSVDEQFEIGRLGLERVLRIVSEHHVPATFFITGEFAERFPDLVRRVATMGDGHHEIASHGQTHGDLLPGHLEQSKAVLERVSGRKVQGFRRARMADTDPAAIARAGFAYNASEHPIWLPGRYNHFFSPRRARVQETESGALVQIPASATPLIRMPLFWLAFKNLPVWAIRGASRWVLASDGVLNTYFHPWEFVDIGGYGLPGVVTRMDGERLCDRLGAYIAFLKRRARLATYAELASRVRTEGG